MKRIFIAGQYAVQVFRTRARIVIDENEKIVKLMRRIHAAELFEGGMNGIAYAVEDWVGPNPSRKFTRRHLFHLFIEPGVALK